MTAEQEKQIIEYVGSHIQEYMDIRNLDDDALYDRIREIALQRIGTTRYTLTQLASISDEVFSAIRGLGLVDTLLKDDTVTEIMINGPENIFIERNGAIERLNAKFANVQQLRDVMDRIARESHETLAESQPILDTCLKDGSRVNIVIPPIAIDAPTMTIRKFSKVPIDINQLVKFGSITWEIAELLEKLVQAKYNIFISGGTGSGKTTFLNALSNFIPKDERIITIEDSAELKIMGIENLVRMETRNANTAGAGRVEIRELIRTSLRMRPSRIVVGEVRGEEALDMLQAMNTGHDGSLSTGHANSSKDMLLRLETMVLQGTSGLPLEAIRQQIGSAIDIIVHLSRMRDRSRKVVEICQVYNHDGITRIEPLYQFRENEESTKEKVCGSLQRTDIPFVIPKKLEDAGLEITI